jgi:thiol-disulfide isomerase/thioredoxin
MRSTLRFAPVGIAALLALILVLIRSPAAATNAGITVEAVKFDTYLARIAANKSAKITMVDAWATWCTPCMENFPHVVEMHKKYANKGLAVVSLSLDDSTEPKKMAAVKKFLEAKGATFSNFVLTEDPTDAFDKLKVGGVPAVFFFGPDGKEVLRFTGDNAERPFTYDDVEQAAQILLDGKPIPESLKGK